MMMREVEEGAVLAMTPGPYIPIAHHRAHVVVQHLARNPAEEVKRTLMTAEQRLQPLIADEFNVSRSLHPSVAVTPTAGRARVG